MAGKNQEKKEDKENGELCLMRGFVTYNFLGPVPNG
jgi:hypothetical protein